MCDYLELNDTDKFIYLSLKGVLEKIENGESNFRAIDYLYDPIENIINQVTSNSENAPCKYCGYSGGGNCSNCD